jgi:hypothetical protein
MSSIAFAALALALLAGLNQLPVIGGLAMATLTVMGLGACALRFWLPRRLAGSRGLRARISRTATEPVQGSW